MFQFRLANNLGQHGFIANDSRFLNVLITQAQTKIEKGVSCTLFLTWLGSRLLLALIIQLCILGVNHELSGTRQRQEQ